MRTSAESIRYQRALMEACLRRGVQFFWRSPGTLLISRAGIDQVLMDVAASGYEILGYEAFEMDSEIHPRLDLVYIASLRPGVPDSAVLAEWPGDVWIDVAIGDGTRDTDRAD